MIPILVGPVHFSKKLKLTRVLEIEIQRLEIDSVATFSPFVDRVSRFRGDGRISTSD